MPTLPIPTMKRTLFIPLLFATISPVALFAQEQRIYSQFFMNPYVLNAAYAGATGYTSLFFAHRRQWINIQGAPSYSHVSFHTPIKKHISVGAFAFNDNLGLLQTSGGKATLGYLLELRRKEYIRFGISFGGGYSSYRVDAMNDPVLQALSSTAFIMADAGVAYYNKNFNVALAIPNLIGREVISADGFSPVNVAPYKDFTLQANYRIWANKKLIIEPHLLYRFSADYKSQFEAAVIAHLGRVVWAGLGYRQQAGASALFGIKIQDKLALGFSYEYGNTAIAGHSFGSAELSLGYQIGKKKKAQKYQSLSFIQPFKRSKAEEKKIAERKTQLAEQRRKAAEERRRKPEVIAANNDNDKDFEAEPPLANNNNDSEKADAGQPPASANNNDSEKASTGQQPPASANNNDSEKADAGQQPPALADNNDSEKADAGQQPPASANNNDSEEADAGQQPPASADNNDSEKADAGQQPPALADNNDSEKADAGQQPPALADNNDSEKADAGQQPPELADNNNGGGQQPTPTPSNQNTPTKPTGEGKAAKETIDNSVDLKHRTNDKGIWEIGTTYEQPQPDGTTKRVVKWTTALTNTPDSQAKLPPNTVRKGSHTLELKRGHHVVAAAFDNFQAAQDYSDQLFKKGFKRAQAGYVSALKKYFTVVHQGATMKIARKEKEKWSKLPGMSGVYILNVLD